MLWTAVGIWIEPLRSTFDYGQINVMLVLAVLYAVYSTRWWLSGLLVGLAAGVKLTPAVSGLYFLGARRWGAAVFSAVVFFGTVAVSALVVGDSGPVLLHRPARRRRRVGPIGTSFNQSWRGGISRILGHDAGYGPLVLAGDRDHRGAGRPGLARRRRPTDRLGAIVVVQLFGLLLSPISWTHHWVWLIPLMIWLLHGPLRERLGARVLGWGWLVLTLVGVPWLLSFAQPTIWQIPPAVVSGLGGPDLHRRDAGDAGWIASTGSRRSRLCPAPSHVLLGDAALGVRDQRESHCPPTDVDVGMVILLLGVLADAAHRVDAVEEGGKLDRPAQGAVGALPAGEGRAVRRLLGRPLTQPWLPTVYRRGRAEPDRGRGGAGLGRGCWWRSAHARPSSPGCGSCRRQGGAGGERRRRPGA